ncbi:helix-turn-helix transcriptional regulator [Cellulomonas iranensis]|uniref:helix-turn-helix transcriptional regulator n=1 Tax=Cellulomonas iranensis TaxID=76862 RepID=UPI000B3C9AE7|nr:hypothetical protein [Cellulomonas iranensis]
MPTTLPPPTAEHLDAHGRWPRDHHWTLYRELDALVEDLDVVRLPRGARDMPADEVAALVAGRVRVQVGVYTPGGGMDVMHSVGWLPREHADIAVDRIMELLPGARLEQERPDLTRKQVLHVIWGSRRPGWSPTALRVSHNLTSVWRERDTILTAEEVGDLVGIASSTWRAYCARYEAGVPISLGTAAVGHRGRALPVWDRDAVLAWQAARPGKGGRPARADR